MAHHRPSLQEHFAAGGPKRILSLDGGGVRGILSLGFLERIEALLRQRYGDDPDFRLCHYFDLIAGTSTGSIIAALLAQGKSVQEVIDLYLRLAGEVFAPRWWEFRLGILRPRYKPSKLEKFLQQELGPECRMGDQNAIQTGLLVMCKRIDTGSPWPISNNPQGRYYGERPGRGAQIPNKDYPLWKIVRASTAAPTFFQPQRIEIAIPANSEQQPVSGMFMDGGVSPHNNPSLQAYWLATLKGFGLCWPTGRDELLITSVGTGRTPVNRRPGPIAAIQGITALQSLMDDCGAVVESLMQGMGHCLNAQPRIIDAELSTLSPHELTRAARFSYARYDVKLYREQNDQPPRDGQDDHPYVAKVGLSNAQLEQMQKMDNAQPVHELLNLGRAAAEGKIDAAHFPAGFDLTPANARSAVAMVGGTVTETSVRGCRPYRQRQGNPVRAIQLNLELEAFTFRKWGSLQTAKQGDWLLERQGDVHTVDGDSFARTYRQIGPGTYVKEAVVWAKPAERDGVIRTREGETHYRSGDYLVWNDPEGDDGYAMSKDKFEAIYQIDHQTNVDEQANRTGPASAN